MKAQIVSFHCVLRDKMGKWISSTFNHDVITHIEGQGMLPALARGLEDLKKGERRRICLTAEQAYGFYDPRLVIEIPRARIDREQALTVGDHVQVESPSGKLREYQLIQITRETLTLDGNHPLAGQDLVFEIETLEARDASSEEIAECGPVGSKRLLH